MDGEKFYRAHRGGSGNVILVIAINDEGERRHGIFGSIEIAQAWRNTLAEDWACVYSPYIVDDPEFGNRVVT